MAMIAYKCPDIQVVVVDINEARIAGEPRASVNSCQLRACLGCWPAPLLRPCKPTTPALFKFCRDPLSTLDC